MSSSPALIYATDELPVASRLARSSGCLRREVADFKVDEILPFELTDEGEHLFVQVRKIDQSTPAIQNQLARRFRVPSRSIGYAGLKDKRSVATQWFSIHVPAQHEELAECEVEILQRRRHTRKLRKTDSCGNRFEILVRDVNPELVSGDRLEVVPNYFGEQRFGRDGRNAMHAMRWIDNGKPRISSFLKSLYISAMRSYLFNRVLAERVRRGNWLKPIVGDVVIDESPTGPMWGRGRSSASGQAKAIEDAVAHELPELSNALEWVGLTHERRTLAMRPAELAIDVEGDSARLSFTLPAGNYATTALRECFNYVEFKA